jgi:hypothetical protein
MTKNLWVGVGEIPAYPTTPKPFALLRVTWTYNFQGKIIKGKVEYVAEVAKSPC